MFTYYNIPLEIKRENLFLNIERKNDILYYKRECDDGINDAVLEKNIISLTNRILLNPVEPLNTPKRLANNLLIEFKNRLLLEPKIKKKIFITFPIEIGIFVYKEKNFEALDIISLMKQKFILYGDPADGIICKYWSSDIHAFLPKTDILKEGIIELEIENKTDKWIEAGKAIFNGYGMKIYYNDHMAYMRGNMKISSEQTAETDILEIRERHMKKSIELFKNKILPVTSSSFLMEAGI